MVYSSGQYVIQDSVLISYVGNESEVNIPEGIVEIKSAAFNCCESVECIFVPASVLVIGKYAFIGCRSLQCIHVDPLNRRYRSEDGIVYSKDGESLVRVPCARHNAVIRTGTKHIGRGALADCQIESINIPDTVTAIGDRAFEGCAQLAELNTPDHVQTIGDAAFSKCSKLASVTLSASLTMIHAHLFSECPSLEQVLIPGHVNKIQRSAFQDCPDLRRILVEQNNDRYVSIDGALYRRDNGGGLTLLCVPQAFSGDFFIPEHVTDIASDAFYRCRKITRVVISSGTRLSAWAKWTFQGCDALRPENIVVPKGFVKHTGVIGSGDSAEPYITVETENYEELQKQISEKLIEFFSEQ